MVAPGLHGGHACACLSTDSLPGRPAWQNPGVRRGKVTGAAESFVALLASSLEGVLASLRAAPAASGGGSGGREEVEEDAGAPWEVSGNRRRPVC